MASMAVKTILTKLFKGPKGSEQKNPKKKSSPKLETDECIVCLETAQCLTTRRCDHPICVDCVGTYINITHKSRMPCPCPSSATCKELFTIKDLTPFLGVEQIQKIWLAQACIEIEKGRGIYCPNSKCSKPVLWTSKNKLRAGTGKCRSCRSEICISCKSAYHTGLTYLSPTGVADSQQV